MLNQSCKNRIGEKIARGPENIVLDLLQKHRQYIDKLKKIQKYSFYFYFLKHLKQQ